MLRPVSFLFFFALFLNNLLAQEINRVTKTDTSVIKTHIFYYTRDGKTVYTAKLVDEFINAKNIVHEVNYFEDTITVESDGYIDCGLHNRIRTYKVYTKDKNLKLVINYDNPSWYPSNMRAYPNYSILNEAKLKGDSIIKSMYGVTFFNNCLKWNIGSSYYFDNTYYAEPSFAMEWMRDTSSGRYSATEFEIVYDIYYENHKYEEAIKLIINKEGHLLPSHKWNNDWTISTSGLEKLKDTNKLSLKPTKKEAIETALKNGLKENVDTAKLWFELKWKNAKDSSGLIFNGHFQIVLSQLVKKKKLRTPSDYIYISKVWVFNPWTGQLMENREEHRKVHLDYIFGYAKKK